MQPNNGVELPLPSSDRARPVGAFKCILGALEVGRGSLNNQIVPGSMSLILGLNAYHGDASACLVRDGVLLAAVEEERFQRIKHWAGFPTESIRSCLRRAGVRLSDIDQLGHRPVHLKDGGLRNYWRCQVTLLTGEAPYEVG